VPATTTRFGRLPTLPPNVPKRHKRSVLLSPAVKRIRCLSQAGLARNIYAAALERSLCPRAGLGFVTLVRMPGKGGGKGRHGGHAHAAWGRPPVRAG